MAPAIARPTTPARRLLATPVGAAPLPAAVVVVGAELAEPEDAVDPTSLATPDSEAAVAVAVVVGIWLSVTSPPVAVAAASLPVIFPGPWDPLAV